MPISKNTLKTCPLNKNYPTLTDRSFIKHIMSPKSTNQFEEMREASKEKIMNAALSLFSTMGYFSTSVSKIASQAGISKGLLYNYFSSKESLLKALVTKAIQLLDTTIPSNLNEINPEDRINTVLKRLFDLVENNKSFMRMFTSFAYKAQKFEFMTNVLKTQYNYHTDLFTGMFRDIGITNPEKEARLLLATVDGIFFQYFVLGDDYCLETIKQDLFDKYQY